MIDERTVRESLERRAGSIHSTPSDPARAVRRARRRLGLMSGLAAGIAVVLVIGGVAGIHALSRSVPPRPATHTPTRPTWSPVPGLRNGSIMLGSGMMIDPATGAVASVSLPSEFASDIVDLAWSPDGTRLAVAKDRGNTIRGTRGLYIVDWPSRSTRLLLPCAPKDHCPDSVAWSPDGTQLAYVQGAKLRLIAPDGTGSTAIPVGNLNANSVTWSPDGSRLAFTGFSSPGSAVGLYVVDVVGGRPTRIADDAIRPLWSPDGSRIAYLGAKLPHRPADQWSLTVATVRPDGSDVTILLRTGSCDCAGIFPSLTWSPDGTEIAAFVPAPGQREQFGLYVMLADGSGLRRVLDTGGGGFNSISWRPVP